MLFSFSIEKLKIYEPHSWYRRLATPVLYERLNVQQTSFFNHQLHGIPNHKNAVSISCFCNAMRCLSLSTHRKWTINWFYCYFTFSMWRQILCELFNWFVFTLLNWLYEKSKKFHAVTIWVFFFLHLMNMWTRMTPLSKMKLDRNEKEREKKTKMRLHKFEYALDINWNADCDGSELKCEESRAIKWQKSKKRTTWWMLNNCELQWFCYFLYFLRFRFEL